MHFCVSMQVGQPNRKLINKTKEITKGTEINQLDPNSPHRLGSVGKMVLGRSLIVQLCSRKQLHVRVIFYALFKLNKHGCATRVAPVNLPASQ